MGEGATHGISGALARLGFQLRRFKTGTPMRLNGRTIDVGQTQLQLGDPEPQPFSFLNDRIDCRQLPCWITFTTPQVHELVRANLHRAPMYTRPDPIDRAALLPFDRNENRPLRRERPPPVVPRAGGTADQRGLRQRPFHEPSARGPGHDGPHDPGPRPGGNRPLRLCDRIRLCPARSVETLAGDEARGRTVLRRTGQRHDRLRRGRRPGPVGGRERRARSIGQGRIGAATGRGLPGRDDRRPRDPRRRRALSHVHQPCRVPLVAPWRQRRSPPDTLRPCPGIGRQRSLAAVAAETGPDRPRWSDSSRTTARRGCRWPSGCGEPRSSGPIWPPDCPNWPMFLRKLPSRSTYDAKYEGYLARQQVDIQRQQRLAARKIPDTLDFARVLHLRAEAREKFERVRPVDLAQAGRISGITPADLAVLMVHLEGGGR